MPSMAVDVVALMLALGHQRFIVVGHDRGSYVAYRTRWITPTPLTGWS
jgi:haloacetate dehalogenase